MGWFTNRSKSWEFKNSLVLLGVVGGVSFLSLGLLTPIAVAVFGAIVKVSKWTKTTLFISLIYLLFLVISLFAYMANQGFTTILTLNFISFYIYVAYMSLYLGEYLQRLDLKDYINLEKDKEYSYFSIMNQLVNVEENISRKDLFINNLTNLKKNITNISMQDDIDELIRLVNVIVETDPSKSDLFFERHASTIENALQQYITLDKDYLQNTEVKEAKEKLEQLISSARLAFENELSKMFEMQILEVDAEAEVYLSILKGRGLL